MAYDLYLKAQQAAITKVRAGADMMDLEGTMHGIMKEAGHDNHIFGPRSTVSGSSLRNHLCLQDMPSFTGKRPRILLKTGTVIAAWELWPIHRPRGVRVEDTVAVTEHGQGSH